jgi:hypothetical protein
VVYLLAAERQDGNPGLIQFSPFTGCGWSESDNHTHNRIELRKAKRNRLSAPALFMWVPQDGNLQNGKGVTRDINASGVYIVTDALPTVGALVQLEVLLPKLEFPGLGMSMAGEGVVLRVEPSGSQGASPSESGFAASVHFYPEGTGSGLSNLRAFGQVIKAQF